MFCVGGAGSSINTLLFLIEFSVKSTKVDQMMEMEDPRTASQLYFGCLNSLRVQHHSSLSQ